MLILSILNLWIHLLIILLSLRVFELILDLSILRLNLRNYAASMIWWLRLILEGINREMKLAMNILIILNLRIHIYKLLSICLVIIIILNFYWIIITAMNIFLILILLLIFIFRVIISINFILLIVLLVVFLSICNKSILLRSSITSNNLLALSFSTASSLSICYLSGVDCCTTLILSYPLWLMTSPSSISSSLTSTKAFLHLTLIFIWSMAAIVIPEKAFWEFMVCSTIRLWIRNFNFILWDGNFYAVVKELDLVENPLVLIVPYHILLGTTIQKTIILQYFSLILTLCSLRILFLRESFIQLI